MSTLSLKAWRDTLAHKGQFIALIVLVALGITSYVTFQNGYYDLKASLDQAYGRLRFAELTARVERAPFSAAREVERIPGVATARVRTVQDVGLEVAQNQQATARIVSTDDPNSPVNAIVVLDGRFPDSRATDEVLLHPKFAGETGTEVGDTLTLRIEGERRSVKVAGIGTDPEFLYPLRSSGDIPAPGDFAIVYTTEHAVERLVGTTGSGNDVAVRLQPGASIDAVAEAVEDELDPHGLIETVPKSDQPSYAALQSELDQNRVSSQTMPTLVLIISSMSLFIALSRLVQAQRGEIGLAKALGYSDAQILGHYLTFGLIIAVGGSILGLGLGLLGARGVAASYVTFLGLPFLESGFYPRVFATGFGLALLSCSLAAIVPAFASARLAPAVAMHSDPNLSLAGGRIPLVERLLSPVLPRSFTFRIPLRNVFRARRRTVYTILGIAFAMVLSVVTIALFDSIDFLLEDVFDRVERWDVTAVFTPPADAARVAEIERLDGVERVQGAFALPSTVRANGREEDLVITAMDPNADFHGFTPSGGAAPAQALEAGEVVLAAGVAERLGVAPGSIISVDTPLIDDPVRLRVGSLSEETLGQPAYVSLQQAAELTGSTVDEFNALYLYVDPARANAIADEIYDMPGVASVQVKAGLVERLRTLLGLFDIFGTVLLIFGAGLAFVVIFTTFTANITERTREIATMRTIGEDNLRLTIMVTLENLLIAIAALPLGIWLGLQATQAFFAAFETESYTLRAYIAPQSIVRISLLMIGVLLLSELPPVRRIFRLDLAEATKVME